MVAMLSSCKSKKSVPMLADNLVEATPSNMLSHQGAMDAINGEWDIVKANGVDLTQKVEADNDASPTITIDLRSNGEGSIYCKTGCNYLNGNMTYDSANGAVKLGEMLSTMMMCPDMTAEDAITAALRATVSLHIEHVNGTYFMYLRSVDGTDMLTARRWDNSRLQGAWEVVQIGNENVQVANVQIVFDTDQGRVHANTGCNIINGTLRLLPDQVGGMEITSLSTTRRACNEAVAEIESRLLVDFEQVTSSRMDADGEEVTLLDAEGNPLIKLHRLILLSK